MIPLVLLLLLTWNYFLIISGKDNRQRDTVSFCFLIRMCFVVILRPSDRINIDLILQTRNSVHKHLSLEESLNQFKINNPLALTSEKGFTYLYHDSSW